MQRVITAYGRQHWSTGYWELHTSCCRGHVQPSQGAAQNRLDKPVMQPARCPKGCNSKEDYDHDVHEDANNDDECIEAQVAWKEVISIADSILGRAGLTKVGQHLRGHASRTATPTSLGSR